VVAVLDRRRPRRTFRRLRGPLLDALLDAEHPTLDVPTEDEARPGLHDTLTGEDAAAQDAAGDAAEGHEATNPQTQRAPHTPDDE
jgi:proteasome alpha subunit